MRQQHSLSRGSRMAAREVESIAQLGEILLVTRPKTSVGGSTTTQLIGFQHGADNDTDTLNIEGSENLDASQPHTFLCAGVADVRVKDQITWNGYTWRVSLIEPYNVNGVMVQKVCTAVREKGKAT